MGKTIPYLVLSLLASALVLLVGYLLFGVEVRGDPVLLFAMILLFLFGALAMGLFISAITDSSQVAFTIAATTTMLPSFLLSGFAFPIESMPKAIQVVSYAIPARYIISILRAVILKGEGVQAFTQDLAALAIFAAAMIALAALTMRRTMA